MIRQHLLPLTNYLGIGQYALVQSIASKFAERCIYYLLTTNTWDMPTKKIPNLVIEDSGLRYVGMTRFELATTRPPDVYSNRAELHPERF